VKENRYYSWFNTPFPFLETNKQKLLSSFSFAGFIYLFLLIFQPFGISEVEMNIPIYLLGFFFITLIVTLIAFLVLPLVFVKFYSNDNWNVWKTLFMSTGIIFVIGILNWWYNQLINPTSESHHALGLFLIETLVVGVFPSILFTLILERLLSDKHQQLAKSFEEKIHETYNDRHTQLVDILSDSDKESLRINVDDLVCIKAEGNYVRIFYYINSKEIGDKMLRNTLSKISEDLKEFQNVKRCHRSYIVNFNRVEHISGNARNYNIHFKDLEFSVPISRSFPKTLVKELKTAR